MPHKKKDPTPLQAAIKSYTAVRNAEKKVTQLEQVNQRRVSELSTEDASAYVKATNDYERTMAENEARIEKLHALAKEARDIEKETGADDDTQNTERE